ncbi:unnamed protein product [Callosobruchus maculatus]|uniref:Uncharacterized protein n=1 Tax=Callosobruchus maculatus TaxID=64391 RepID=A0A653BLR5_CALMS|nr:unnamed protein product [Callosobruchus maculatus]
MVTVLALSWPPVPVECAVESHSHCYLNCRSMNRGTQNFELPHNGLLTSFLDDCHALYLR